MLQTLSDWLSTSYLRSRVFAAIVLAVACINANAAIAEPDVVVREIFDELLFELDEQRRNDTLSQDSVRTIFTKLLNPRIEYTALAQWILRDHWRTSTPVQQEAFLSAFEAYIINTYALALANGQRIQLIVKADPVRGKNTAVVSADFIVEDADAVPLSFRLLQRDEQWYLFDVAFSGVSLARTFRSDFSYVAQDGGIEAVTAHLNRRHASRIESQ